MVSDKEAECDEHAAQWCAQLGQGAWAEACVRRAPDLHSATQVEHVIRTC
jgi:hypothetical protein